MSFRIVDVRLLRLKNCEMFGRVFGYVYALHWAVSITKLCQLFRSNNKPGLTLPTCTCLRKWRSKQEERNPLNRPGRRRRSTFICIPALSFFFSSRRLFYVFFYLSKLCYGFSFLRIKPPDPTRFLNSLYKFWRSFVTYVNYMSSGNLAGTQATHVCQAGLG